MVYFQVKKFQKLTRLCALIALGLILFIFESFLPRPLPWVKVGLANLATLLALYWFGFGEALVVVVIRVGVGGLMLGTLFNPAFLFALGGGVIATLVMGGVRKTMPNFGVVGVSIWGALAHNLTQLGLAYLLFIRGAGIFYLLPMFLFSSLFAGVVIGVVALFILERLPMLSGTTLSINYLSQNNK
ncbi:Gx transporter family protein [candidate division KSB1 bacterium]|nr:Gx transporter family protein [candidate division KSB1 bacterium]